MNKNVTIQGIFLCIIFIGLLGCHDNLVDNPPENLSDQELLAEDDAIQKKKDKCPICHFQENQGTYKKLNINCGNAYNAHLSHGDGEIGGPVPGNEGFVFGENCELIELIVECPCFSQEDIDFVLLGSQRGYCIDDDHIGIIERARGWLLYDYADNACAMLNVDRIGTTSAEAAACVALLEQAIIDYQIANSAFICNLVRNL